MSISRKQKDKLAILIIGGSGGAKIFSKIIPSMVVNLPAEVKSKLYIYQQVKEEDVTQIKEIYNAEGIDCEIKSFFTDMNDKLAKANLVIARSGASTIAELITACLPAILIPLPSSADNHQYYNAKEMDDLGASWRARRAWQPQPAPLLAQPLKIRSTQAKRLQAAAPSEVEFRWE